MGSLFPVLSYFGLFDWDLSYYILYYYYFLVACFLTGANKEVDLDGRESEKELGEERGKS